jgi:hypothetical protein
MDCGIDGLSSTLRGFSLRRDVQTGSVTREALV